MKEKNGKSRFLRVKCNDCQTEKTIFDKADSIVMCEVCGATIALPKGGRAEIKGTVVKVLQ